MSVQTEVQSVSTGVVEDNYEYVWKIQNFLKIPKQGKLLESQKFEIRTGVNSPLQSKWVVGLKNSTNTSGVQCYHVYCELKDLLSASGDDQLECKVTIEPREPDGSAIWTCQLEGRLKVNNSLEVAPNYWWNSSTNFNGFMDGNGSLNIYIKLSLLRPVSETLDGSIISTTNSFLEEQFRLKSSNIAKKNIARLLLADSTEFDIKIVCSDAREFKCHSLVLKANSSVFDSMLKPGFSESKTGVIKINDIAGKAMEVLLQYLYTGDLLPIWKTPDVVTEFTYAAGKYQINELVEFLDSMIAREHTVDPSNCLELLNLTQKMSLKKAEGQIMAQIAKLTVSAENSADILALFQKNTGT